MRAPHGVTADEAIHGWTRPGIPVDRRGRFAASR
jgi:hypothetical protein